MIKIIGMKEKCKMLLLRTCCFIQRCIHGWVELDLPTLNKKGPTTLQKIKCRQTKKNLLDMFLNKLFNNYQTIKLPKQTLKMHVVVRDFKKKKI